MNNLTLSEYLYSPLAEAMNYMLLAIAIVGFAFAIKEALNIVGGKYDE